MYGDIQLYLCIVYLHISLNVSPVTVLYEYLTHVHIQQHNIDAFTSFKSSIIPTLLPTKNVCSNKLERLDNRRALLRQFC